MLHEQMFLCCSNFINNCNIVSGIGMDSSVTPVRHGGLSLVQTTDFFYPLVDDPYMMGKKGNFESIRTL